MLFFPMSLSAHVYHLLGWMRVHKIFEGSRELVGTVPNEIIHLSRLATLRLENNTLSGTIPLRIGSLKKSLLYLNLSNNRIKGGLPKEIYKLSKLLVLDLHNNFLNGDLDRTIENIKDLKILDIHSNRFSGQLPYSMIELDSLEYIDVSNNNFQGYCEDEICQKVKDGTIYKFTVDCLYVTCTRCVDDVNDICTWLG
mmetsp:Transcript_13662/g.30137  ORF Transcript_13662/g.30137 Transcript_13662/m.30137 type:complete len:197 (-) Transcript_13662:94-684(-)